MSLKNEKIEKRKLKIAKERIKNNRQSMPIIRKKVVTLQTEIKTE